VLLFARLTAALTDLAGATAAGGAFARAFFDFDLLEGLALRLALLLGFVDLDLDLLLNSSSPPPPPPPPVAPMGSTKTRALAMIKAAMSRHSHAGTDMRCCLRLLVIAPTRSKAAADASCAPGQC
jgi:hypothetical protein